jgi:hypothetical protein
MNPRLASDKTNTARRDPKAPQCRERPTSLSPQPTVNPLTRDTRNRVSLSDVAFASSVPQNSSNTTCQSQASIVHELGYNVLISSRPHGMQVKSDYTNRLTSISHIRRWKTAHKYEITYHPLARWAWQRQELRSRIAT